MTSERNTSPTSEEPRICGCTPFGKLTFCVRLMFAWVSANQ
jgi:hypothetical protein